MPPEPTVTLTAEDALILVDVQNDFCPGGKLSIREGDQVIAPLNTWIARARQGGALVVASRDWHPPAHASFETQGGDWPEHCLQHSTGAEIHPDLDLEEDDILVSKGNVAERDAYSAFDGTGLAAVLGEHGIRRVWIGGLALDVCVEATALAAAREGFQTNVILDATRPVTDDGASASLQRMREAGVAILSGGG